MIVSDLGVRISQIRVKEVLKLAGVVKAVPQTEITAGAANLVWLADFLATRKPVSIEEQRLIISEFAESICRLTDESFQTGIELKVAQLVIIDSTFASLSGEKDYLDLRDGSRRAALKQMPIEVVSINLVSLHQMHTQRIAKRVKTNDAETVPTVG